ncbi:MAG: deoxynucleoside kinase [Betaproteobacteria bacterium]|nr:MAG: deoxynucleoside kinase [Betaproteobacteria bacterium]
MKLEKYRYIVVEGPIGVGKTSLARRIADHLNSSLLLEAPDENPFLEKFYGDISRYALPTQLFFLFQRNNQVQSLAQMDMFERVTVSDFLLEKDQLFAKLTLSDTEHDLYQRIYCHLQPKAPPPDLVIYLQAPLNTLIDRVKQRRSFYEKNIYGEYLSRLSESYIQFFYQYKGAPVMIVNSENLNFVDNQPDFDLLLQRVEQMSGPREYFNWGS